MERRDFLKNSLLGAGGIALASSGIISCNGKPSEAPLSWNFDDLLDRSDTWSIKHSRAKDGQLAMWIADMDFRTDPRVSAAMRERLDRDGLGYTFIPAEFGEAVSAWTKLQYGYEAPKEWIGYAPGVITALNQAYEAFTESGDGIIIQPPVYDHFKLYIERLGRKAIDNPLIFEDGKYRMDLEGLEKLIDSKTKALVLCNPQNPSGQMWDKETLTELASICRRHGILVFSDEIHADLCLGGRSHVPFYSVSDDAREIGVTFGSPSKSFNLAGIGGTAYSIIANDGLRESYSRQLKDRKLDEAPLLSTVATIAAYTNSTEWLDDLRKYLQGNVDSLIDYFKENITGIVPLMPEASFLVWLDCRGLGLSQKELISLFSDKAGVIVNNGESYGTGGSGFVRINVGCPRSVLKDALERIRKAVSGLV